MLYDNDKKGFKKIVCAMLDRAIDSEFFYTVTDGDIKSTLFINFLELYCELSNKSKEERIQYGIENGIFTQNHIYMGCESVENIITSAEKLSLIYVAIKRKLVIIDVIHEMDLDSIEFILDINYQDLYYQLLDKTMEEKIQFGIEKGFFVESDIAHMSSSLKNFIFCKLENCLITYNSLRSNIFSVDNLIKMSRENIANL